MARTKRRKATTSGFFRKIFDDHPELLDESSNAALLKMWHDANPQHKTIPSNIKQNLANLKSNLRKKGRDAKGRKAVPAKVATGGRKGTLEFLEESIDECMTIAKNLDRAALDDTIKHLRRARNLVVWKMGQ